MDDFVPTETSALPPTALRERAWVWPACVLGVVLLALAVRLAIADHPYLAQWDEAYHALVAKNFMENPLRPILLKDLPADLDIHFWGRTTLWLHKPPLAMWLMAASMKVFGQGELALRLPSVLADTLLTLLIILAGARFAGRGVGIAAGLIWALNAGPLLTVAGFSPSDHPDAMLLIFSNAALLLYLRAREERDLRRRAVLGFLYGAACAMAYLSKGLASAPTVVVPFFFELAVWWRDGCSLEPKRETLASHIAAACGVALALPWALYSQAHYGKLLAMERKYDLLHFSQQLEGHVYGPMKHFEVIAFNAVGREGAAAGAIGLALVIAAVVSGWRAGGALRVLAVWVAVYFTVYTFAATRMRNYCLPAHPALFILAARFVAMDVARMREEGRGFLADQRGILVAAALALLVMGACINTAFVLRGEESPGALEGQSGYYLYSDMRREMKRLADDPRRGLVWNLCDDPTMMGSYDGTQAYLVAIAGSFFSGKTALAANPSEDALRAAAAKGLHNWIAVPRRTSKAELEKYQAMAGEVPIDFIPIDLKADAMRRAEPTPVTR